jgi:hypothetical protein
MIRIEPNNCQALLAHDDAIDDLKAHGWDIFLTNLMVTTLQTFNGLRAKVKDI